MNILKKGQAEAKAIGKVSRKRIDAPKVLQHWSRKIGHEKGI